MPDRMEPDSGDFEMLNGAIRFIQMRRGCCMFKLEK